VRPSASAAGPFTTQKKVLVVLRVILYQDVVSLMKQQFVITHRRTVLQKTKTNLTETQ
jgi:hypothetical protein